MATEYQMTWKSEGKVSLFLPLHLSFPFSIDDHTAASKELIALSKPMFQKSITTVPLRSQLFSKKDLNFLNFRLQIPV